MRALDDATDEAVVASDEPKASAACLPRVPSMFRRYADAFYI